jgi:arylsulfatase A-like enzyme
MKRALLAGLLLTACTRPAPLPTLFDLAATAGAADREGPWQVVLFGTPSGISAQLSGFYDAPESAAADPSAWVTRQAEIGVRWPRAAPRAALLDLAPFPGLAAQSLEVLLNDKPVGAFALETRRRRYRVELPTESQEDGFNKLRLAFAATSEAQKNYRKRMSAVLYSLAIAPASDARLADLLAASAPPPFSIENGRITQAGPGRIAWVLRAPEAGEVRVSAAAHPAARAAGVSPSFRIFIEEDGKVERSLWTGSAGDVSVPLGVAAGTRVRLSLAIEGGRFAWGEWPSPRIVGRVPADPLATLPGPAPPDSRADALRRSLKDANVLYVILDAAGARHFSSYGYDRRTTPEIDRIASEGLLFEDARTVASFTLLAMSSTWTSVLPNQHHNGALYNAALPHERVTLAELLGASGIHTAGFVSNGVAGPGFALDRGFSEFDEVYKRFGSSAEAYRRVMPDWLAAHRAKRFFAYVHFREPHFAYDPPPPFTTLFGPDAPLPRLARTNYDWITDVNWHRVTPTPEQVAHLVRLYDGNLAYVDREVGELRRALEAAGLWDKTLVIVSADHGDGLYEHAYIGHLDQVYEDQLWIPLVVKFPKSAGPAAGARIKGFVDTLDIAPTIADAFGVLGRGGSDRAFLGRSLLDVASGAPGRPAVLSRCAGEQPKYALRVGAMKLVYHTARDASELYDLAVDPTEQQDLARTRPLEAAYYRQTLERWILEMRRGPRATATEAALSDEQRENLKALGYVQ